MRYLSVLVLACAALLGLAGCDYPEAGFFELVAVDGGKQVGSFPFMVEELTDDTDLTIGFNILLPRNGELVLVPLENGTDLSRRNWLLRLADRDTGAGDVQLQFIHESEEMRFTGAYRQRGATQSESFSGKDIVDVMGKVVIPASGDARLAFETRLPERMLGGKANSARWELRPLSQSAFEKILGGKLDSAPRREAAYMAPLRAVEQSKNTEDKDAPRVRPGRLKRDPSPGGGRQPGP
jgi:hypothetical protein